MNKESAKKVTAQARPRRRSGSCCAHAHREAAPPKLVLESLRMHTQRDSPTEERARCTNLSSSLDQCRRVLCGPAKSPLVGMLSSNDKWRRAGSITTLGPCVAVLGTDLDTAQPMFGPCELGKSHANARSTPR